MEASDIVSAGPWGLAMAIFFAVWRGDLRLKREVEGPEKREEELKKVNRELSQELRAVTESAQRALREEQESTRLELAELRKTNALLVERLMRESTT